MATLLTNSQLMHHCSQLYEQGITGRAGYRASQLLCSARL
jgi:hypothetical protein